jgi:hypothetical protein
MTSRRLLIVIILAAAANACCPRPKACQCPAACPTAGQETVSSVPPEGTISQWASSATASSQFGNDDWSAVQATGAPNTPICGDATTAWAMLDYGGTEWLEVRFDTAVIPSAVTIYETNAPGAIVKMEVGSDAAGFQAVWTSYPQTINACPHVLTVPVEGIGGAVNAVRITLDTSSAYDWPEIDAVELEGVPAPAGSIPVKPPPVAKEPGPSPGVSIDQWASNASASSQFGGSSWSAGQATGAPDTPVCGDSTTAWASAGLGTVEWLEVGFDKPVYPMQILIHQSNAPGFVVKVEVGNPGEALSKVWESAVQTAATCPAILDIPVVGVKSPVSLVRITVDMTLANDWCEIDAVQLVGMPAASAGTGGPPKRGKH